MFPSQEPRLTRSRVQKAVMSAVAAGSLSADKTVSGGMYVHTYVHCTCHVHVYNVLLHYAYSDEALVSITTVYTVYMCVYHTVR